MRAIAITTLVVLIIACRAVDDEKDVKTDSGAVAVAKPSNAVDEVCLKKCGTKFGDSKGKQDACSKGCAYREESKDLSFPYSFITCTKKCLDEGMDKEEESSCKYACSMPTYSSIQMSIQYMGQGEKPIVHVQHHEGVLDTSNERPPFLPEFIGQASIDSDESDDSDDDDENHTMSPAEKSHYEKIKESMMAFMTRARQQMRKDLDNMGINTNPFENMMTGKPSGHNGAEYGHQVGNFDFDGFGGPIIRTQPRETEGRRNIISELRDRYNRMPHRLHWVLLGFGMLCLCLGLIAAILFLRAARLNAYRRIKAQSTWRVQQTNVSPLISEKKVETGWMHTGPKEGAPPAYDQVSIHSIKKEPAPADEGDAKK